MRVGIVGVGVTPFRPTTPEFSWKELMYDGAQRSYADAGIDPRSDVGSFITCAEDYYEGFGIFDEFTPDQLGAVLRPMHTVGGDGIQGLANAVMQIRSGLADVVVVESHSKASDILTFTGIVAHGLDPIWNKPLGGHPNYVAGLEMDAFLRGSGNRSEDCAAVVAANRQTALLNPIAAYGARVTKEQAAKSPALWAPLRQLDASTLADGCVVLVVAGEAAARKMRSEPVWIEGIGWASDSPSLETRDWVAPAYATLAAEMAYRLAKVRDPARSFDLAEVDDKFSYKELQHLEALRLARKGHAGKMARSGDLAAGGKLPTNVSGGSLGCGNVLEASGLHRVAEAALQLRGEAGRLQLDGVRRAVVQSWRGLPSASGGVAVLGVGR
ncbi:MAG: acetyl-CoA acetyltransferase [Methanobacteriota archaeon]|nr:MAG: acetyl-CoA acetyltransferase [Euryarchaeota archaeon]